MRLVMVGLLSGVITSFAGALPAVAQEEKSSPTEPAQAGTGASPEVQTQGEASEPEPWYQPTPNFGGNMAQALRARFDKALPDSPSKSRITCYMDKIAQADSDDRVIWWTRICPTYQNDGSTEEVCGIGDFNEEDLHKQIKRPEDVDTAGRKLRLFAYLKSVAFNLQAHMPRPQDDATVAKELERTDRDIQLALRELDKIEQALSDGTDSQRHYHAIRAWIQRRQADPKSVYSCR
jgi:hypothetical protein